MGKEKPIFTLINENGEEVEFEVLFTFDSDETKKSYIVYTDNELDEQGNKRVYASIYNPDNIEEGLQEITTDKEWDVIEKILKGIEEKQDTSI